MATGRRLWLLSLAGLVGVLVGAGGFTFVYAKGYSYLQDDPDACVNCHVMRPQFEGWRKSTHHAVATCNACHVPEAGLAKWRTKGSNGFWHSYYFTFQNFHEPIAITERNRSVLNENCVRCHEGLVHEIAPREEKCVRCHDHVGHEPAASGLTG